MKAIDVSQLKAYLNKFFRMAARCFRREETIPWRERLAKQGRLRLGTQDWGKLRITRLDRPADIQAALGEVRADPGEVRRH